MDSFANLLQQLTVFETKQFCAITRSAGAWTPLLYGLIHGGVQSVVLDNSTIKKGKLPVIVAIGINYHQCSLALSSKHWPAPYLTPPGTHPLIVSDSLKGMRLPMHYAFTAYRRNTKAWTSSGAATASVRLLSLLKNNLDFHLVAFNFSPFITQQNWSYYKAADQTKLLHAWPWAPHFHALFTSIARPDLVVAHGASACLLFRTLFPPSKSIPGAIPWMCTYNLSGLGLANMKRASKHKHLLYR